MTAVTTSFAKLMEPGLRELFFDSYKEKPEQFSKVFEIDNSKKHIETDYRQPGFGLWSKKGQADSTNYQELDDPITVQYKHTTFSDGFTITKEMVDDELYNVMKKKPKALAFAARATIEQECAAVLNNAFTASARNANGEALIANNHKLLGEGAGTSSNHIGTLALSETSLETAFKLAREQVNEKGLKIAMTPKLLIVPPALEFTAEKIAKSVQLPGTNNNDINPMRGRFQVFVYDYLESDTAWFLVDPSMNPLQFFWREKLNFKATNDFDTDQAKYKGRMRFSFGWTDWRGIIGSTGV